VESNPILRAKLASVAERYREIQSTRGLWAGDLEFRGLAVCFKVDLHVHYVDASEAGLLQNGHRVDVYPHHVLVNTYFSQQVEPATETIHIVHTGGNHYMTGRPKRFG
jgi:hypothetical protein